ncbi:MAG TPA: hypothetical protein VKR58_00365 [Aquella sp.]|nr:hypothetical protein [Aquella sp.]
MIKSHFVLKYADSHNKYVHVKPDGAPSRTENPNLITQWECQEHALRYCDLYKSYRFILQKIDYILTDVNLNI